jgi:hypothetical protein
MDKTDLEARARALGAVRQRGQQAQEPASPERPSIDQVIVELDQAQEQEPAPQKQKPEPMAPAISQPPAAPPLRQLSDFERQQLEYIVMRRQATGLNPGGINLRGDRLGFNSKGDPVPVFDAQSLLQQHREQEAAQQAQQAPVQLAPEQARNEVAPWVTQYGPGIGLTPRSLDQQARRQAAFQATVDAMNAARANDQGPYGLESLNRDLLARVQNNRGYTGLTAPRAAAPSDSPRNPLDDAFAARTRWHNGKTNDRQ